MANELNDVREQTYNAIRESIALKLEILKGIETSRKALDDLYNDIIDNKLGRDSSKIRDNKLEYIQILSANYDMNSSNSSSKLSSEIESGIEEKKNTINKSLIILKNSAHNNLKQQEELLNSNRELIDELKSESEIAMTDLGELQRDKERLINEIALRKNQREGFEEIISNPMSTAEEINYATENIERLNKTITENSEELRICNDQIDKKRKSPAFSNKDELEKIIVANNYLMRHHEKTKEELKKSFGGVGLDIDEYDVGVSNPEIDTLEKSLPNNDASKSRVNVAGTPEVAAKKVEETLPRPLSDDERAKNVLDNYLKMPIDERLNTLKSKGYDELYDSVNTLKDYRGLNNEEKKKLKNIIDDDKKVINDDLKDLDEEKFNSFSKSFGVDSIDTKDFSNIYGRDNNILNKNNGINDKNLKFLKELTGKYNDLRVKEDLSDTERAAIEYYDKYVKNPIRLNVLDNTASELRHPTLSKLSRKIFANKGNKMEELNNLIVSGDKKLESKETSLRDSMKVLINDGISRGSTNEKTHVMKIKDR